MAGRIIGFGSCMLCAIPFFLIVIMNRNNTEPIQFWTGDDSLKKIVNNVKDYNREMRQLYFLYGNIFVVAGLSFLIYPLLGVVLVVFQCTFGLFLLYKYYKKILRKYS